MRCPPQVMNVQPLPAGLVLSLMASMIPARPERRQAIGPVAVVSGSGRR
jgi:hypothetical protein